MPTFPLEIIEAIIGLLEDDPSSLRSCRLTCSALSPRCRRLLFRTVQLDSRRQLKALVAVIQRDPALGDLIHTIVISSISYHDQYLIASSITELTLKLPKLSSINAIGHPYNRWLDLYMADRDEVSLKAATLACLRSYSSVQELCLCRVKFLNHMQLARMLTSLPSIRHLRCLSVSCGWRYLKYPLQTVVQQHLGRLRLQTLTVSNRSICGVFDTDCGCLS